METVHLKSQFERILKNIVFEYLEIDRNDNVDYLYSMSEDLRDNVLILNIPAKDVREAVMLYMQKLDALGEICNVSLLSANFVKFTSNNNKLIALTVKIHISQESVEEAIQQLQLLARLS